MSMQAGESEMRPSPPSSTSPHVADAKELSRIMSEFSNYDPMARQRPVRPSSALGLPSTAPTPIPASLTRNASPRLENPPGSRPRMASTTVLSSSAGASSLSSDQDLDELADQPQSIFSPPPLKRQSIAAAFHNLANLTGGGSSSASPSTSATGVGSAPRGVRKSSTFKNKKEIADVLNRNAPAVPAALLAKLNAKKAASSTKRTPNRLRHRLTLLGIRMTGEFKDIARVIQQIQRVPLADENSLLYMLRSHQEHADSQLSQKIATLCNSKEERSQQAIEQIIKILSIRLRSFSQFPYSTKLHFCRIMQYEKFEAGALIVKEGHISLSYYLIVSGQLEVFILRDGFRHRLNLLNPGDSFGRVQLLKDNNTACISTLMDTELLRIDKEEAAKTSVLNDQQETLSQLRRVPHFSLSDSFIKECSSMFTVLTYEPNETILFEGAKNVLLHWIVVGQCRCTKVVPFLQRKVKTGAATTRTVLFPHTTPNSASSSSAHDQSLMHQVAGEVVSEEIVNNLLTIHELGFGDHFPDLPKPPGFAWITEAMFERHKYLDYLESMPPQQPEAKSFTSVVANSKVVIASIPLVDYARVAPPKMVLWMFNNACMPVTSVADLQQAYLEKRKWDTYKKEVVKELRK
ncbi:hypothetical protein BC831DRAFT_512637 [Entophlyctis helioformis]|nr:hypothetical protein BC831DRAFT_512637 [Entophlyctis helioformis]